MPRVLLSLRSYKPTDLGELHSIEVACYPPALCYSLDTLLEFMSHPEANCWVASLGPRIVGFIIASCSAQEGHIITLDVVDSARRQGAGSALIRRAEHHIAKNGARIVKIETAMDNKAAIAFGTRHGYCITGSLPNYYSKGVGAFLMSKSLVRAKEDTPLHVSTT